MTSVGVLGAPREPSEHYVEEVANRSRLLHQKVSPGAHCGALLASAGQLVAPGGLLFDVLFVTLGRCWGPLGPKLQKVVEMNEKMGPERVICHLADSKSDVAFLYVFLNNS